MRNRAAGQLVWSRVWVLSFGDPNADDSNTPELRGGGLTAGQGARSAQLAGLKVSCRETPMPGFHWGPPK